MFGELVRSHRHRLGMTQEDLAGKTGVGVRTIRDIESGRIARPRPGTVRLLADAFGLRGPERDRFHQRGLTAPDATAPAGGTGGSPTGMSATDARPGGASSPSTAPAPPTVAHLGEGSDSAPRAAHRAGESPAGPDPAFPGEATGRPRPAQLPADVAGFTGRTEQVRLLDALLGRSPAAVTIATVVGTAGVGKTSLAVHWAHRVAGRFGDGQLYVNLRGFDPHGAAMHPAEAIRGFLDAFGVPPQRLPVDLPAQAALYRSLLADKRILVLLDNARDADQVRPLLPGAPGCLVVVTSRDQLSGLVAVEGAHPLTLDLLPAGEARQLLGRRVDAIRMAADTHAVDEILTRCARLPLALAVVAARAATRPDFALSTLARELSEADNGLDALDAFAGGDPGSDVRAVFSWSYRTLSGGAARLFRLLGRHPGPGIGLPAAASLAGLPPRQVRPLLAELSRAHLVTEQSGGRYTMHDLLRAYAVELTQPSGGGAADHRVGLTDDDAAGGPACVEWRAALDRVLDHYLHTAYAADQLLYPQRDRFPLSPAASGVTPEPLSDPACALAWFTAEQPVLLATIDHAVAVGADRYAWQLAWLLATFLDRQGHWHDWAATGEIAAAATRHLGDQRWEAAAHRSTGGAYAQLGRYDDARRHLDEALVLAAAAHDHVGQAHTHRSLGWLCEQQADLVQALRHDLRALELFRASGHRGGEGNALNAVGWGYAQLGDYRRAIDYCEQGHAVLREIGDRYGEANTWDSLGYAHHHLGDHIQAIACYQRALELNRETGDRYNQAEALTHLGDTHHAAGDTDEAHRAWRQAAGILDELGHPDAEAVHTRLARLRESARRVEQ